MYTFDCGSASFRCRVFDEVYERNQWWSKAKHHFDFLSLFFLNRQNRDSSQQADLPRLEPPDPESRHPAGVSHSGDQWDPQSQWFEMWVDATSPCRYSFMTGEIEFENLKQTSSPTTLVSFSHLAIDATSCYNTKLLAHVNELWVWRNMKLIAPASACLLWQCLVLGKRTQCSLTFRLSFAGSLPVIINNEVTQ